MLETEIKLLREAIEANTAALLGDKPTNDTAKGEKSKVTKVKKTTKKDEPKVDEKQTEDEFDEKVTSQTVKDLAKAKMAEGVARATIKGIITKLGVESIADLDDDGLLSLNNELKEL